MKLIYLSIFIIIIMFYTVGCVFADDSRLTGDTLIYFDDSITFNSDIAVMDFDTFTFNMDNIECDKFKIEFVIEGVTYKYPCKELKTIIQANKPKKENKI